jgi:predicted O-methyltransferase YrrM
MAGVRAKQLVIRVVDLAVWPFAYAVGVLLREMRSRGLQFFPRTKRALLRAGVMPIRNHYYEPLFDPAALSRDLDANRALPGIDWNLDEQLEILDRMRYGDELRALEGASFGPRRFTYGNNYFSAGEVEFWYSWVRRFKPKRIYEIGSGYSTMVALAAIRRNREEDPDYACRHIAFEPFENAWLAECDVELRRQKAEDVDPDLFGELASGDVLFIDSSHVIRPQGDVVFELLEVLPRLAPGVVVHIHDIFSPRDYPRHWVFDLNLLWNEQYMLEAFLSMNMSYRIVGALNLLSRKHYDRLSAACPLLTPAHTPTSFYIRREPVVDAT